MSIRAINWALTQRTDGPSAQIVLFVVADTANENGVSIHADPDYIAEKTRQSRATVFRRLDELERMGALTRLVRHTEDGRRVYEIRLFLNRSIDYIKLVEEVPDVDVKSQFETDAQSQIETGGVAGMSAVKSHSSDSYKNPSKSPKEESPPQPPLRGGGQVVDQALEEDIAEFTKRYPAPITNLPKLRLLFAALEHPIRQKILTAELGYAAYIAEMDRKGKARAVKDADRWVSQGMWEGYLQQGEKASHIQGMVHVAVGSEEGRAWATLHEIAHLGKPLEFGGKYLLPQALSPQGTVFAKAPPDEEWVFIEPEATQQVGAWNSFLTRELAGKARPPLVWDRNRGGRVGFLAPWPWPPRKDGLTYQPAEKSGLVSPEDERQLADHGL